jgi:hypothetical protein
MLLFVPSCIRVIENYLCAAPPSSPCLGDRLPPLDTPLLFTKPHVDKLLP